MTGSTRTHQTLPGNSGLFLKAALARKKPLRRGATLPDIAESIESVAFSTDRLTEYEELCGFQSNGKLPITAPHVLAAPLHTALLTREEFPIKALGLIHVSNRILQYRRIDAQASLSIHVGMGPAQWVPKGMEFNLMTTVREDGEVVWEEVSTIFWRGAPEPDAPRPPPKTAQYQTVSPDMTEKWELPPDQGRRYAAVSGDYNPIHLWPLTARPFGFRRPIIHGMWSLARCAAALQEHLSGDTAAIDIQFRRPILLPSTVNFEAQQSSAHHFFSGMTEAYDVCFTGSIRTSLR